MKNLVLLVLLSVGLNLFAQDAKVSLSEKVKAPIFYNIMNFGLLNNNMCFVGTDFQDGYYLDVFKYQENTFNKQLIFKSPKCSSTSEFCVGKDYLFPTSIFLDDAMIVFFNKQIKDKSGKTNLQFAKRFSNSGNFEGELTSILDYKNTILQPTSSVDNKTFFIIEKNQDPNQQNYILKVFGSDLKITKNINFSLPYTKFAFEPNFSKLVNNQLYLLLKVFIDKDKLQKGQTEFFYTLFRINTLENNIVKEFKINLENKNIRTIMLKATLDNISIAGTYFNLEQSYANSILDIVINGYFFMDLTIDAEKFDNTFLVSSDNTNISSVLGKQDKIESGSYDLVNFFKRKNGTISFITEYQKEYMGLNSKSENTMHYERNNIFVLNVNNEGNYLSHIIIYKKQDAEVFDYSLSFFCLERNNNLYFVFNDNPDNLTVLDESVKKRTYGTRDNLFLVVANENGTVSKKIINSDYKMVFKPKTMIKLNNEYVIPFSYNETTYQTFLGYLKLTF